MSLDSSQLPRWGVAFELASSTAIVNRPPHLWRLLELQLGHRFFFFPNCIFRLHTDTFQSRTSLVSSDFSHGFFHECVQESSTAWEGKHLPSAAIHKKEEVISVYRKSCKPFFTLMSEYCTIEEEHRKSHYSSSRNGKKGYLGTFLHRGKQWSRRFLGMIVWDPSVCKSNRLHIDILQFSFIRLGGIFYKFL